MSNDSNDLYNLIMQRLEEKKNEEYNAIEKIGKLNKNEEKSFNDSKSSMISEFLDNKDFDIQEKKEDKKYKEINKDKKKRKENLDSESIDDNCSKDLYDIKKTRKLLFILVIIQILLLSVLLYILYNKIFETRAELVSPINNIETNGLVLMEGYLEIPSIKLQDHIYEEFENNNKLMDSLVLFKTLNGLNRKGNSVITGSNPEVNKSFTNLGKVKVDDKIYISVEDLEPVEYNVVEVKEVDETELDVLLSTEKISITLIARTKNDNKRLIIKAETLMEEKAEIIKPENKYRVTTDSLNVRPEPSFNNIPIKVLNTNDVVVVVSEADEWYEIKNGDETAYVSSNYLEKIQEVPIKKESKIESSEKQLEKIKKEYKILP